MSLRLCFLIGLNFFILPLAAAAPLKTMSQRLGYDPHEKLLILHMEDLGIFDASTRAVDDILNRAIVQSASVMITGPEAQSAVYHLGPRADLGLHLALSSEYEYKPLRPSSNLASIDSLVDGSGNFLSKMKLLIFAETDELIAEMESQISAAKNLGLTPTHMDAHEGIVFFKPSWLVGYLNLALKHRIPPFIPSWSEGTQGLFGSFASVAAPAVKYLISKAQNSGFLLLDDFYLLPPQSSPESYVERKRKYLEILKNLRPGVTQITLHPTYADSDFASSILSRNPSEIFRHHDAHFLQDPEVEQALRENNIRLITWREVAAKYPWHEITRARQLRGGFPLQWPDDPMVERGSR